jgi:hypothetical protein
MKPPRGQDVTPRHQALFISKSVMMSSVPGYLHLKNLKKEGFASWRLSVTKWLLGISSWPIGGLTD